MTCPLPLSPDGRIVLGHGSVANITAGGAVHVGLGHDSTELFQLYQRADIFVVPSRGDVYGLVYPEAMACGLPLVGCDVGAARGFVGAPSISGPIHIDSVGGGVSQVATTLYNAAFFAGLRVIAHTPHSFYISRYPKGREANLVGWARARLPE